MKVLGLLNFAVIFAIGSAAHADPKELFIKRRLQQIKNHNSFDQVVVDPSKVQSGIFTQTLNHDDAIDKRTFQQRYHLNTTYALNSQSPTILYICGEATCDQGEVTGGAVVQAARALKANIITLEHRYYGQSHPFKTLEAANLKYLTSEYALRDLDVFQKWAVNKFDLRGKWISMGGSYAGALSAFYRLKYPQNVVGALASSAPVLAKADFEEYDRHVTKVAGADCAAKMRETVKQVEERLKSPAQALEVKKMFDAELVKDDVDFLYVVADMGAFAIQYGFDQKFCGALIGGADPVSSYAEIGKELFSMFGMTPYMDSFASAESVESSPNAPFELRQWMYQSCNEFGYYQIANHDPALSVRSTRIDLPYHNDVCKRLFGMTVPVDTQATNHIYYENILDPQTKNIFFTNGEQDPWSNLSISTLNGNASNPNLAMQTIAGAAHCDDLRPMGSPAVEAAKAKFLELAKGWLQ